MQRLIDINKIDPSPFQVRKYFDEDKLKELGESIQQEGSIKGNSKTPRNYILKNYRLYFSSC